MQSENDEWKKGESAHTHTYSGIALSQYESECKGCIDAAMILVSKHRWTFKRRKRKAMASFSTEMCISIKNMHWHNLKLCVCARVHSLATTTDCTKNPNGFLPAQTFTLHECRTCVARSRFFIVIYRNWYSRLWNKRTRKSKVDCKVFVKYGIVSTRSLWQSSRDTANAY